MPAFDIVICSNASPVHGPLFWLPSAAHPRLVKIGEEAVHQLAFCFLLKLPERLRDDFVWKHGQGHQHPDHLPDLRLAAECRSQANACAFPENCLLEG
jgi:hypothetical protein